MLPIGNNEVGGLSRWPMFRSLPFRYLWWMLVAVGDLVDDVVVHLEQPPEGRSPDSGPGSGPGSVVVDPGSDTPAVVTHRQGGSAANVCVAAAHLGAPARFVGRVGDDPDRPVAGGPAAPRWGWRWWCPPGAGPGRWWCSATARR